MALIACIQTTLFKVEGPVCASIPKKDQRPTKKLHTDEKAYAFN
jgi:hypothetical protein